MENTNKQKRWIGWLYTAILVIAAVVGVAYCLRLRSETNAADNREYYAVEETRENNIGDIIDLGDISTDVPLSDVTE